MLKKIHIWGTKIMAKTFTYQELLTGMEAAHNAGDFAAAKGLAVRAKEAQGLEQKGKDQGYITGAIDQFTDAVTFGQNAKLAGLDAGLMGRTPEGDYFNYDESFKKRYNDAVQAERLTMKGFSQENPKTAIGATIAGAVLPAIVAPAVGSVGLTNAATRAFPKVMGAVGQNVGRGVAATAEGAGIGAAYASGADENILEGAKSGALFGLGGNLAGRAIGGTASGIANRARGVDIISKAPSQKLLRKNANKAYKDADEAGIRFLAKPFAQFAVKVRKDIKEAGAFNRGTPKTMGALDEIDSFVGTTPTFQNLSQLRAVAKSAAGDIDPNEARLGVKLINYLDDYVDKGSSFLGDKGKLGRQLWGRTRRDELLEDIIEKASRNTSGIEQGMRVGFRSLLANKKLKRGFSQAELDTMKRIVNGTGTTNMLRAMGKLGFDMQRTIPNVVGGGVGGGIAFALGGPVGVGVQQGASIGARRINEQLAKRNADVLRAMVRSGIDKGKISATKAALEKAGNNETLAQTIIRSSGVMGADQYR